MTHYQGIQFVSWIIRLLIFQQISQYSFKNKTLVIIPGIIAMIDFAFYPIIFWGEIFFLPIISLILKYRKDWNWTQYFFYSFFSFAIDDILMRVSTIYFQFIFRQSYTEMIKYDWSGWITMAFIPLFYITFFKILKIDINTIHIATKKSKLYRTVRSFNASLIIYSFFNYVLSNFNFLNYAGIYKNSIDDIYYQRLVLFCYLPIFIGFLFYISYIVKWEKNLEVQKVKDIQIKEMLNYNNHIESLYKEIRGFRHDYSNILLSLNESIKNKDISSIQMIYETVLDISAKKIMHSKYDIGNLSNLINPAMKSIVSAKLIEAQNNGISLTVEIESPINVPSNIELLEFLQMLSIFLDNAIEGSLEASAPNLSFAYFEGKFSKIMIIENTIKDERVDTKSIYKIGYSSKGKERGIGLANIQEILNKNPKIALTTDSQNYIFKQEVVISEKNELRTNWFLN